MRQTLRFLALFIAAFICVAFLPLYINRSMIRSQMESGGDIISWEWNLRTLYSFWTDYHYFRSEEDFAFWLTVNLGLACFYAFVIALSIILLVLYRKRRRD